MRVMQKVAWFSPGSNRGPLACEASVITTTLLNPLVESLPGIANRSLRPLLV